VIEQIQVEDFACTADFTRNRDILYTYMENVVWESLMV